MHTSRIKLFQGYQIEVTVTRFDDEFCTFTNIRPYGLDHALVMNSIFAEWTDQRARSCKVAFQHAFERAHREIARTNAQSSTPATQQLQARMPSA